MALQTLNTIKNWFKTGLKPTQTQFWDTWDSFRHKYEKVPVKDVDGLDELLLYKADKVVLDNHLADKNAHAPQINTDWNSNSGFSQLLNKPEFKTINGEAVVGSGDIVIKEKELSLQNILDHGNVSNTVGTEDEHFKLISKLNASDIDNHTMTFKNNAISAEFKDKGYTYAENGIFPTHSLSGTNQGYSITNDGLSLKTNPTGGLAYLKSDNIIGKQTLQLPNNLTTNSIKTLISSVNGVYGDDNGNVIIESQNLQKTLKNGSSFEAHYGGGIQKINAFDNENQSGLFTIETIADGENSSSNFSLEGEGSTSLFGKNGNKSSLIAISEGDMLLNYSTDSGSTDVKFSAPTSNTTIEFPAKPNRPEPYTLATTDDIIGENGLTLQKLLENGSRGIIPTGVKIGHNATDDSTWSTLNLKEGDGIDLYSSGVFNLGTKGFYLNSSTGGGFVTSGDPSQNEPLRINSQGSGMEIGGGAGGLKIDGQGGAIQLSGADYDDGGIVVKSRLGIGRVKNIGEENIEIMSTQQLRLNGATKTTLELNNGADAIIEMENSNGSPQMNIRSQGEFNIISSIERLKVVVPVSKGMTINEQNIVRSVNGVNADISGNVILPISGATSKKEYVARIDPSNNSVTIYQDDIGAVTIERAQPYSYAITSPNILQASKIIIDVSLDSNTEITDNRNIDYVTGNMNKGQIILLMRQNNVLQAYSQQQSIDISLKITIYS